MIISGFIATNTEPEFYDIEKQCKSKGYDFETDTHSASAKRTLTIRHNQININISTTPEGIKYKARIPELWSYIFICVILVILLFKLLPLGIWVMLSFFVTLILVGIKIAYDKHIYKIADSVVVESLKFLPEKATKEQIDWLKNPNICPACGAARNPYSDKCLECGLSFGAIKKLIDNQSQTCQKKVKTVYTREE